MKPRSLEWKTFFRGSLGCIGIIALVIVSFILASWASLPLSMRSAHRKTPSWFRIVIFLPPNGICLITYREIKESQAAHPDMSYVFAHDRVDELNLKLREYTGSGITWKFEILDQRGERQHIHVTTSGDDDIIESWYWATKDHIEPEKFRWLNPGVIFIVIPLTFVFAALGFVSYRLICRWT